MILSLIIPVYNVEKYLEKCLNSIAEQSLSKTEYEVLIVDDGSPDNSAVIAKRFVTKYPNFKLISQTNQGLSRARNTGARHASGDYLWFIDSDDWISPESLSGLKALLSEYHPDMLCFDITLVDDNGTAFGKKRAVYRTGANGLYDRVISDVDYNYYIDAGLSQKDIFNRDFFLKYNLFFKPGIIHEDEEQSIRAFLRCRNMYLSSECFYNYLVRTSGSIMSTKSIRSIHDRITTVTGWWRLSKSLDMDKRQSRMFYGRLFSTIYRIFSGRDNYDKTEYDTVLSPYKRGLYKLAIRSFIKSPNYNTVGRIVKFSLMTINPKFCVYFK